MRLPIDIIPQYIIDEYQLIDKVKMAASCVKSDGECMELHRYELLQTNYKHRGFQSTDTAPVC